MTTSGSKGGGMVDEPVGIHRYSGCLVGCVIVVSTTSGSCSGDQAAAKACQAT